MNKIIKTIAISTLTAAIAVSSFGCSVLKKDNNDSKDSETSSISEKKFEDIKVEVSDSKDAPLNETNINELDKSKTEDIDKLKEIASADDILVDMDTEVFGMDISVFYAKKGKDTFTKYNMYGIEQSLLIKDDKGYLISDENKIYSTDSQEAAEGNALFETANFNQIFAGEIEGVWDVEIDGGTFRRYKIKSKTDSDDDMSVESEQYVYLYNGELKYIVYLSDSEDEGSAESTADSKSDSDEDISFDIGNTIVKIKDFKATDIDDKYFSIPDDYKEVTTEEYSEKIYSDLDLNDMFGDQTVGELDDESADSEATSES